jgi:hypothetical protein
MWTDNGDERKYSRNTALLLSLSKNDYHLSIFNEKWAKQYFYLRSEGTKYNELKWQK